MTEIEVSGETAAQPGVKRIWLEIWHPIKRSEEEIVGFSVIAQEITQRKEAEDELRRSQHRLAEAERISQSGRWDYDILTNVAAWSDNMYRLFDVDPRQFSSQNDISSLIHPEDGALVQTALTDTIHHHRPYNVEYRIVRKDGSTRIMHSVAELVFDNQGRASRMIGRVQDITERRQAEEQHQRLQGQLTQAQKMETVGRLAGGIAHEFNNLLAIILMRTELSLSLVDAATPLHRNLTMIHATTRRSAELVRQLLGFARKQVIAP